MFLHQLLRKLSFRIATTINLFSPPAFAIPWFVKNSSINVVLLLVLIGFLTLPRFTSSANSTYFYYFNPDSAHSNFLRLKQVMDIFLTEGNFGFSFQPFSRFTDFDRQVKEKHPGLVFLPEWYLKQDGNDKQYKPFLQPVYQGVSTYRKVLLVGADSSLTIEKMAHTAIAMTPVGQSGMNQLNEALFKEHGLDSNRLSFITTTKDADALLALALGQVKAALISEKTFERVGKLNPQIIKNVKSIAVSAPLPLPMLCYAVGGVSAAELKKMRNTLLMGKQDKNIGQIMEMLDIDAWKDVIPQ